MHQLHKMLRIAYVFKLEERVRYSRCYHLANERLRPFEFATQHTQIRDLLKFANTRKDKVRNKYVCSLRDREVTSLIVTFFFLDG